MKEYRKWNVLSYLSVWVIAFFCFVSYSYAKLPNLQFRYLAAKDGLVGGTVSSIIQSRSGFMWIGMFPGGIYRYDGYNFKRYSSSPKDTTGLLSDDISALTEDSSGRIWAGTHQTGIYSLDPKTGSFVHYSHNEKDTNSLSSDGIDCLITDSKKRLWVLTKAALDLYDPIKKRFIHYTYDKGNKYFFGSHYPGDRSFLLEDPQKGVMIITGLDVFYIDFATRTLKVLPIYEKKQRCGMDLILPGARESIAVLIYGQKKRICKVDISTQKVLENYCDFPAWICNKIVLRDSMSYLISTTSGLFIFNTKTRSTEPVAIDIQQSSKQAPPRLYSMLKDNNDNIWLGSRTGGLYVSDKSLDLFSNHSLISKTRPDEAVSRTSRSIIKTKAGTLITATAIGDIFEWDTITQEFNYMSLVSLDYGKSYLPFVTCLYERANGDLWTTVLNQGPVVMKERGTNRIRPLFSSDDTVTPPNLSKFGRTIYEDKSGCIWVGAFNYNGSQNDFMSFNPTTKIIRSYKLPLPPDTLKNRSVTVFIEDRNGMLWIGTSKGLYSLDRKNDKFTRYHHDKNDSMSLSDDEINCLLEDKSGRFWVCTSAGVLNLFDRNTGKSTHFTESNDVISDNIRSILEDEDGSLWMSGRSGILKFDPLKKTYTAYGWDDGVLFSGFQFNAAAKLPSGEMFFGSADGITSFFPRQLSARKTSAPLVITSLAISGVNRYTDLTKDDTINLEYDENNISIEFAALDFKSTINKRYAYRLDGLHDDWVNAGNRNYASFTNIAPGDYVFRVKVFNREGEWDPNEIAIRIHVSPPYWATWCFRSGVALMILLVVGYAIRRKERIRQQHLADLEAAREKERVSLASELHDGPLQDLYATRFMIGPIAARADENTQQLEELLAKVRSDLRSITSELQIPRFDLGFAEELKLSLENFHEMHPSISVVEDIAKEEIVLSPLIMQNLFRIFRTSIGNIVKHAEASEISVRFHSDAIQSQLIISDNGKGFIVPSDVTSLARTQHYGLFMMNSFAVSIGAKCEVVSSLGKGTTVSVSRKT